MLAWVQAIFPHGMSFMRKSVIFVYFKCKMLASSCQL